MPSEHGLLCSGPVSRRSMLRAGALGATGLGLADLLSLRADANVAGSASDEAAVIFIWLPGGPPHMEMYDMKPDAPVDYRGEFRPIHTNVPGLDVCELMPLHAKCADRYNIIRSVAHTFSDHGGAHKRFMTGRKPATPTGFVNDAPAVGSIIAKAFEHRRIGLPNYVCGTDQGRHGVDVFSLGASYLGRSYTPFMIPGDPADPKFSVQNLSVSKQAADRLDDRARLLKQFDRLRSDLDRDGSMEAMDRLNQTAVELLTSSKARSAFDLSKEPDKLRDRFGRHGWGQRCLLARRLIEAGCKLVTMVLENPYISGIRMPKNGTYNWDSHAVNCHLFEDARVRLPIYDQAITALVEDLYDRGLDKHVMLIVTGEFGRTPRINVRAGTQTKVDQPGRDHWPQAMSMLVAGAGMRTGQVIGQTNAKGEEPKQRPLTPNDLWATVYRHLGIDYRESYPNLSGRPMPILPFGEPIAELL